MKTMTAKYPGKCFECSQAFPKGTRIKYYGRLHIQHETCPHSQQTTTAEVWPCWECKDPNGRMRSYGAATPVYCDACEARIRPTTLDYKLRHPVLGLIRYGFYKKP